MNVAGQSVDITQLKLGSRFAYPIERAERWTFTPELHGYYVRNLNTSRIVTSTTFLAGGSFINTSPARDTDIADLGLGLTIAQKGPFALSAVYDYSFGQTTKDSTFYLRVKSDF
jgi:outer membrane autotransporter protein